MFATARSPQKIPASLTKLPNVHVVQLDVVSPTSIAVAVKTVKGVLGGRGLDMLVNNSGIGTVAPMLDLDIAEAKNVFEVNFWGVLQTTQGLETCWSRPKGRLLTISSIAGELPDPHQCKSQPLIGEM